MNPSTLVLTALSLLLCSSITICLIWFRRWRTTICGFPNELLLHLSFASSALAITTLFAFPESIVSKTVFWLFLAVAFLLATKSIQNPNFSDGVEVGVQWFPVCSILCLFAIISLTGLSSYSGALVTWESPVSVEFGNIFQSGKSLLQYSLETLLWEDGLMSSGQKSFLYGVPTYTLLTHCGFNPFNLRITSVIYALGSITLIYVCAKSLFNKKTALIAASIFALNPTTLYYARYGTSMSATFFSSLLALYFVIDYFKKEKVHLYSGLLAGASFFIATLTYATARLVLVAFFAVILAHIALNLKRLHYTKFVWVGTVICMAVAVFFVQYKFNHHRFFFAARGEQIVNFMQQRDYLREFLGKDLANGEMTFEKRAAIAKTLLRKTWPELISVISPANSQNFRSGGFKTIGDPPAVELYFPFLFPFILLGLLSFLRPPFKPERILLLAWLLFIPVVLLFTSRVDVHRMVLISAPLAFLAAHGCSIFYRALPNLRIARIVTLSSFSCLAIISALLLYEQTYSDHTLPSSCKRIHQFLSGIESPVKVGMLGDHTERSWNNLLLLERNRQSERKENGLIRDDLTQSLNNQAKNPVQFYPIIQSLKTSSGNIALAFWPAEMFSNLEKDLQSRNIKTIRTSEDVLVVP